MASRPRKTVKDPATVADVRAVRSKMWRDAGGNLKGLIKLARKESTGVGKRGTRSSRRGAA